VHERAVKLAIGYTRVPARNVLFRSIKPNALLQSRFVLRRRRCRVAAAAPLFVEIAG